MNWRDPKFAYVRAEESRKPGYLARRMALYRKIQAATVKPPVNVTKIKASK